MSIDRFFSRRPSSPEISPQTDAAPAQQPAGPPRAADRDETIVVDAENGWAIGTEADLADNDGDPVHDVLKKTDVWFAYKASALEKESRELAEAHAVKGQPRHDLVRDGPLEMEVLLEQHAGEVMWGWMDRVRRKMQAAVETETEKIGMGVARAKRSVANAEAAHIAYSAQQKEANRQIPALRVYEDGAEAPGTRRSDRAEPEAVVCERHMGARMFWILSALLIGADFLANVPVFVELFPANRLVDEAFRKWERVALNGGLTAGFGLNHLFRKVMAYPESSLLALSVIVFFLVLGHELGGNLRVLVALHRHRTAAASPHGSQRWRQALVPGVLSLLGALVVVVVLFQARAKVLPMAESRVVESKALFAAASKEYQEASTDPSRALEVPEISGRMSSAQAELDSRSERLEYAKALSGMNVPITCLNVVLVLAAVVLGYVRREEQIEVTPDREAQQAQRAREQAAELRAKLDALRAEFVARRADAHEAMRESEIAFNRVQHVLEADVMRDWYGKAERLRRAIPLFRTENARQRGLDVEDIAAFRTEIEMDLPTPAHQAWQLDRPSAIDVYRREFGSLEERLHHLDLDLYGRPSGAAVRAEA